MAFPALCCLFSYSLISFSWTTNTDTLPRADTRKDRRQILSSFTFFLLFLLALHFTRATLSCIRPLEMTKGICKLRVLKHPPRTSQKHLLSTSNRRKRGWEEGTISSGYTTWPLWLGGIYSVTQQAFFLFTYLWCLLRKNSNFIWVFCGQSQLKVNTERRRNRTKIIAGALWGNVLWCCSLLSDLLWVETWQ